jgi:N-methylhydantoinase A
VPYSDDYLGTFHKIHRRTYGYARQDAPVEVVNVRVRAIGKVPAPEIAVTSAGDSSPEHALMYNRQVFFDHKSRVTPFYLGEHLLPGNIIIGPAVILRADTTILLKEGDQAICDPYLNLHLDIGKG